MTRRYAAILSIMSIMSIMSAPSPSGADGQTDRARDVDPRWLERLDADDRACLERLIGYAPPAFPATVGWPDGAPTTWPDLRGRVVVLQSWTSRTQAGRSWAERAAKLLGELDTDEVVLIALHTPRGADDAAAFLARRPLEARVAIDPDGAFCDAMGLHERPANVVVDRNGSVRYVGLNRRGMPEAVSRLLAEPVDPDASPETRPVADTDPAAVFPPFAGSSGPATDVRGKRAPEFFVQSWINGRPDARDKVVVVDFWATWCGPCVRSIPHINELADRFRDDVVCVAISDESRGAFQSGLRRRRLKLDGFRYALALDPSERMKRAINVRAIPHTIVMSSDWVVRWQGNPASLDAATLARIIEADKALRGDATPDCARWIDR